VKFEPSYNVARTSSKLKLWFFPLDNEKDKGKEFKVTLRAADISASISMLAPKARGSCDRCHPRSPQDSMRLCALWFVHYGTTL
jgi:hypothetical protein